MYNTAPIRDLVPHAWSLEGFLFPATYKFPRHPKAQDVANAMVQKFKEHWARIAAGADAPDVNSVATLASLVERETPQPDERPLVAGVFENRLSRRIALQCDPTVIYALERTGQYKGALSSADLHVDSPYNTYRYRGLPPGPIGNPGEASLQAALAPAETDYLYFVANAHGGHFFAETLAEHNRNVARYRRLMAGRASLYGTVLRARPVEEKAAAVQAFARSVVPLLGAGRTLPTVDHVFPAAQAAAAFDYLARPGKFGKILLEFA